MLELHVQLIQDTIDKIPKIMGVTKSGITKYVDVDGQNKIKKIVLLPLKK